MNIEDTIHVAGQKLVTVTFDYTEADGSNEGAREVEPYSYKDKNGKKFMGYDIGKDGIRAFVPENIHNISITSNHFEPRWPIEV